MGDRGNIVVQEAPGKRVYLYTHWRGSQITDIAKRALGRKQRWTDHSYLTRIVFCEMVKDDIEGETGYGISSTIGDNSHRLLVVDCEAQAVHYEAEDGSLATEPQSFADFIAS